MPGTVGFRLILGVLRGFLLVALGAGTLVPALHFSLVKHELCAEHGELRHRDAHSLVAARPSGSVAPTANAASTVEDEHEHCAVIATSSNASVSASPPASTLAPAPEARAASLSRADIAHVSLDLLHYAPKLAPPG